MALHPYGKSFVRLEAALMGNKMGQGRQEVDRITR